MPAALSEPVASSGLLTPEQEQEIAAANARAKKVRRAASVAQFNGWASAILAVCSAPFAIGSLTGFLVAAGLAVVAWNEFRGRRGLLRFEPEAANLLGWNQLGLLALICCYCFWQVYLTVTGTGILTELLATSPEARELVAPGVDIDSLVKLFVVLFYGLVVVLSVVFQGANAWYYFSRRKTVEAYLRETPDWVVDLQRVVARN